MKDSVCVGQRNDAGDERVVLFLQVHTAAIMLMVTVAMTLILEAQKYLKMTMLTTKMVTTITQTAEEPGAVLDQDLVGRLRAAIRSQLSVGLLFYFASSDI